jgi:hypothetical protein
MVDEWLTRRPDDSAGQVPDHGMRASWLEPGERHVCNQRIPKALDSSAAWWMISQAECDAFEIPVIFDALSSHGSAMVEYGNATKL